MSGILRSNDGAPPPPPKTRKERTGFLSKVGRPSGQKSKHRLSQYVEPIVQGDEGDVANSTRLDVIDQLDITGLHGASLFHHDSPYDACSPHSNLTNTKTAPVRAFGTPTDPLTSQLVEQRAPTERVREPRSEPRRSHRAQSLAHRDAYRLDSQVPTSSLNAGPPQSDMANPNAEYFGVAAEPWQELATPTYNTSHPPLDAETPSGRTSRSSNFADMETYLRGSSNTNPSTTAKESLGRSSEVAFEDGSAADYTPRKGASQRGASTSRSKSLLGRLRRLKVDPDEVGHAPADEYTHTALTRSQQRVPSGVSSPDAYYASPNAAASPSSTPHSHYASYGERLPLSPEVGTPVALTSRRGYAQGGTPYLQEAEHEPSWSRAQQPYASPPMLPPKDTQTYSGAAPPLGQAHHAEYTQVVPDAGTDKPAALGRSKSFFSRLASSSRARVI